MEWTEERLAYLRNNYHKETCQTVARNLGCSIVAVQVRASQLGLKNINLWTVEEDRFLKEMYPSKSNKEVAQILNRTPSAIKIRALKKFGLHRDHNSIARVSSEVRGNPCNHHFFEFIDTPEKAYFLGYIIGDGSVRDYQLNIVCSLNDIEMLYFFKIYLGKGYFHFPKGKNYASITINSYGLVTDLKKYGVVSNKAKIVKVPDISDYLMRHVIRGLFDLDGCIYISPDPRQSRASITGNQFVCSFIKDYIITILNVNGSLCKHTQNETVWTWSLGGRKQLRKLYTYLYKDATIFLSRKHNKFVEAGLHNG